MQIVLERIFQLIDGILPGKASYGTNIVEQSNLNVYPFIVYQEISDRAITYADNYATVRLVTYQITLVTENKDILLEERLEEALYLSGYSYQMITEYLNDDNSINRVYEIKMEEIKNE